MRTAAGKAPRVLLLFLAALPVTPLLHSWSLEGDPADMVEDGLPVSG